MIVKHEMNTKKTYICVYDKNGIMEKQVVISKKNGSKIFIPVSEFDRFTIEDVCDSEWVDLGLPSGLKWARCNVGTTLPDFPGSLIRFQDISEKIGDNGRLPSSSDFKELMECCKWTWKEDGYEVKGCNGNSIFLPLTGKGGGPYSRYDIQIYIFS